MNVSLLMLFKLSIKRDLFKNEETYAFMTYVSNEETCLYDLYL